MEAFYDGYNALRCDDWEFIVKLDGDLSFSPDYFKSCFEHFREEPQSRDWWGRYLPPIRAES